MKVSLSALKIPGFSLDRLKKIPLTLASHAFLMMLFSIFLTLMIGVLIFYQYVIAVEKQEPQITEKVLKFETATYESILESQRMRSENFQESRIKEYLNPFKPPMPIPQAH